MEYSEDYNSIIARGDINNILSDKGGIEGFNAGISYILFSDEMEQIDEDTAIMFIGYADDVSGEEISQAVMYYSPEDISSIRSLGRILDSEAYLYASKSSITSRFSQYLENFDVNRPVDEDDPIERLVIFSVGISKDSPLPALRD